jgi:hypothetical protein
MRHFQNPANGQIHGYDVDGSQDDLIGKAIDAHWEEVHDVTQAAAPAGAPQLPGAHDRILELEASVTPRRLREAILTERGRDWLVNIYDQIEALRKQLS